MDSFFFFLSMFTVVLFLCGGVRLLRRYVMLHTWREAAAQLECSFEVLDSPVRSLWKHSVAIEFDGHVFEVMPQCAKLYSPNTQKLRISPRRPMGQVKSVGRGLSKMLNFGFQFFGWSAFGMFLFGFTWIGLSKSELSGSNVFFFGATCGLFLGVILGVLQGNLARNQQIPPIGLDFSQALTHPDPEFDQTFAVKGDELYAAAALSHAFREQLNNINSHLDVYVEPGHLLFYQRDMLLNIVRSFDMYEIELMVSTVKQALLSLNDTKHIEQIVTHLATEPASSVRLRTLRLLLTQVPKHASTKAYLKRAVEDESPEVRDLALLYQKHGILPEAGWLSASVSPDKEGGLSASEITEGGLSTTEEEQGTT